MTTSELIPLNRYQQRLDHTHIERVTKRTRRHYVVDPASRPCPSITTVLGKVIPKPALMGWYQKRSREAMRDYLAGHIGEPIHAPLLDKAVAEAKIRPKSDADEAAALGTQAHDLINRVLLGEDPPVPDALEVVMATFHEWFDSHHLNLVDSEVAVYGYDKKGYGYAGTIDALFERGDRLLLVDWKTSNAVYEEHKIQVAQYARAMAPYTGSPIDAMIVRLGKDEVGFEVVEIEPGEYESLYRIWDAAFDLYNALESADAQ